MWSNSASAFMWSSIVDIVLMMLLLIEWGVILYCRKLHHSGVLCAYMCLPVFLMVCKALDQIALCPYLTGGSGQVCDLYCSNCDFCIQMLDGTFLLLQMPMLSQSKYSAETSIIFLDSIMSSLVYFKMILVWDPLFL